MCESDTNAYREQVIFRMIYWAKAEEVTINTFKKWGMKNRISGMVSSLKCDCKSILEAILAKAKVRSLIFK